MKLGVIADDFTGASDIALTVAEAGFRVAQFIGVPGCDAGAGLDAGVVALKSRSAPVDEAVAQSLAACDWLLAQGATQIVFKVCSTFDSTPRGNIGPVLDALAERLGAEITLVCPAFPENGRSVYQGHLFVVDKLLSESGMQDHPLTPMTDPDLRRVLDLQSAREVGHIPALTVLAGAETIRAAFQPGHLITDAIRDADLMQIGRAARDLSLICGGSGIAMGLPANWGAQPGEPDWQALPGPGVVISGSCSRATRAQVRRYREMAPSREISAGEVVSGAIDIGELADWVLEQPCAPLVYSSADPAIVAKARETYGRDTAALAIEALFQDLAQTLAARGLRRFVVAGGETSGAVVRGLSAERLEIGPRLAPGVPALRLDGTQPAALALKSGNFGGPDFFAVALAKLEGSA